MLNEFIELWWNKELFSEWCYVLEDWVYNNKWWRIPIYSFHDIFSKDSGLMEFVERKEIKKQWKVVEVDRILTKELYVPMNWYEIMWPMTAEMKVEYFTKNARVPTK